MCCAPARSPSLLATEISRAAMRWASAPLELLYDSKAYAVVVNAAVGFGLDTNAVGTRGVVSLQW